MLHIPPNIPFPTAHLFFCNEDILAPPLDVHVNIDVIFVIEPFFDKGEDTKVSSTGTTPEHLFVLFISQSLGGPIFLLHEMALLDEDHIRLTD